MYIYIHRYIYMHRYRFIYIYIYIDISPFWRYTQQVELDSLRGVLRAGANWLGAHYWAFYPLVMTNIAMENGPFIDGLPIKNGDFPWQTVK